MADPTMVTKTAIFVVDDGITKATGSSDVCAPDPVLLDQSAPFDIVDHQTLLRALSSQIGISGITLNCTVHIISQISCKN